MIANIPILLVAVALLWIPRSWLRRGMTVFRRRSSRSRTAPPSRVVQDGQSLSFRREFTKGRNYCDLARAGAGALALFGSGAIPAALRVAPGAASAVAMRVLAIQAAILLVGVLAQTLRYERKLSLAAPVFYLAGLSLVLFTPFVALCAFAVVWACSTVVPNSQGFLTIQGVLLLGIAIGLNGIAPAVLLGFVLFLLPVLLSLLARQPLIVFSRRSGSGRAGAA
jgi:hypothetical protein